MDKDFDIVISSPIRWAGSKKKLLNEMLKVFFVREKNNYIEPFLGSGVVLINVLNNNSILKYKNFYVNDVNKNVINFYITIKDNVNELIQSIKKLEKQYNACTYEEKEKMYYDMRDKYNNIKTKEKSKTAIFYFLMKAGFNGVYRENKKGEFNVPFGKKDKINVDYDNLIEISNLIQTVNFYCMDYSDFFEMLKEKNVIDNSFVYCDPPYLITTGSYNDGNRGIKDWTVDDEKNLLNILDDLNSRGVKFALSNVLVANDKKNDILTEWSKKYTIYIIKNTFNNSNYRRKSKDDTIEVLITNYEEV